MSTELFVIKDDMSFKFYQEDDDYGWIIFRLDFLNFSRIILISIAQSPIEKMMKCIEQVISNHLPTQFEIDEEGKGVKFIFLKCGEKNRIRFELRDLLDPTMLFYTMIVDKFDFCEKLLRSWSYFVDHEYRDELWNYCPGDYDLREIEIDYLFNLINKFKIQ